MNAKEVSQTKKMKTSRKERMEVLKSTRDPFKCTDQRTFCYTSYVLSLICKVRSLEHSSFHVYKWKNKPHFNQFLYWSNQTYT